MSNQRLTNLLRHIEHVRDNCTLLGNRLITDGDEDMGHRLIALGQIHDNSKFYGIEWEHLNDGAFPRPDEDPDREMFLVALKQHVTTNPHHPEYWGGVEEMPSLYIAEMVGDWKARSNEQGTDLADWVRDKAAHRFKFSTSGRVYKEIKRFMGLLLERKF